MIIKGLMTLLYNVFSALTSAIDIPQFPEQVHTFLYDFLEYIQTGLQILAVYTHLEYLLILFGIVIVIDAAMLIYHFVMWVLKKIPMLGIE